MHKSLLMPARSGMPVQAKCWYAAGDEPLMSKREARITLLGLNKQLDVVAKKILLMPARSGRLVHTKCWHAAWDEPLMSEREARITLTGLNKQPDVLCIQTFLCLHAAVCRYKQKLVRYRG